MGAGVGAGIGLGEGLSDIGQAIRLRRQKQEKERDSQAQELGTKAQAIAENIRKALPSDYKGNLDYESLSQIPEVKPLADQLNQITQQHNSLYQPHEAPALVRNIQKFFGKKSQTGQAPNQETFESEIAAAPGQAQQKKSLRMLTKEEGGGVQKQQDGSYAIPVMDEQGNVSFKPLPSGYKPPESASTETPINPNDITEQDGKGVIYERDKQGNIVAKEIPGYKGKPARPLTGELGSMIQAQDILANPTKHTQPEIDAAKSYVSEHDEASKEKRQKDIEDRREAIRNESENKRFDLYVKEQNYSAANTALKNSKKGLDEADRLQKLAIAALKAPPGQRAILDKELVFAVTKQAVGRATLPEIEMIFKAGGLGDRFAAWTQGLETGELPDAIRNRLAQYVNDDYKARKQLFDENQSAIQDLAPKANQTPGDLKKKAAPKSGATPQKIVVTPEDMK